MELKIFFIIFVQYLLGDCFEEPLWSPYPCQQTIETEELYFFSSTSIIKLRSIYLNMR